MIQDFLPSEAQRLRRRLARQGIAADSIMPHHLQDAYDRHRAARPYAPPDFGAARALLPEAPPRGLSRPDDLVAVLVETRPHPNLETVVDEVISRLGIPVQIFHGPENEDFVRNSGLAPHIRRGQVVLTALSGDLKNEAVYNALLMTRRFWEHQIGRKQVLFVQTDAALCSGSPYAIEQFMEFDYIGPLYWQTGQREGMVFHGGVGGLTLRSWTGTMKCLKRFPAEAWSGGEDKYFSFHLDLIGRVGRFQDCARFCSQHRCLDRSFAVHKATDMHPVDLGYLLDFSAEAARVAGGRVPDRRHYARFKRWVWGVVLWSVVWTLTPWVRSYDR